MYVMMRVFRAITVAVPLHPVRLLAEAELSFHFQDADSFNVVLRARAIAEKGAF